MLVERNPDTTAWPKMDITNCRSMELLRRLGVADGLRDVGEWISLGGGSLMALWLLMGSKDTDRVF